VNVIEARGLGKRYGRTWIEAGWLLALSLLLLAATLWLVRRRAA
jgi:hypothetical protein